MNLIEYRAHIEKKDIPQKDSQGLNKREFIDLFLEDYTEQEIEFIRNGELDRVSYCRNREIARDVEPYYKRGMLLAICWLDKANPIIATDDKFDALTKKIEEYTEKQGRKRFIYRHWIDDGRSIGIGWIGLHP